jgi:hypothetical protein
MPLSRSLPALAVRTLAAVGFLVLGACGSEIGDACQLASDCSPDGDRVCLRSNIAGHPDEGGYCAVVGCDPGSCPDEAVCVRFYAGAFAEKTCDPRTEDSLEAPSTDDCSLDEVCSVQRRCALRASEVRYCLRACEGGDDCRAGYHCRDRALMEQYGGEPVTSDGEPLSDNPTRFCAANP